MNQSGATTWAVAFLDGSDMGWRWPRMTLEVRDSTGRVVAPPRVGRCGNMDPLRMEDIVELAAGQGFDPCDPQATHGQWRMGSTRLEAPGRFTIRLIYDTNRTCEPGADAKFCARMFGDGTPDESLMRRVRQVPEGVFASDWLQVEVGE